MASMTDVYEQADRMVLAARELDKVMAVIASTGVGRDFDDAIGHAREIGDAYAKFLDAIEDVTARRAQNKS